MAVASSFITVLEDVDCPEGNDVWSDIDNAKVHTLQPHWTDFILCGKCTEPNPPVQATFKLEHSPDNVNWTPVLDSQSNEIILTCLSTTGRLCVCKTIDTPLLSFVRAKCGQASKPDAVCTLYLFYANNK